MNNTNLHVALTLYIHWTFSSHLMCNHGRVVSYMHNITKFRFVKENYINTPNKKQKYSI